VFNNRKRIQIALSVGITTPDFEFPHKTLKLSKSETWLISIYVTTLSLLRKIEDLTKSWRRVANFHPLIFARFSLFEVNSKLKSMPPLSVLKIPTGKDKDLVDLTDDEAMSTSFVGGKAANLAILKRLTADGKNSLQVLCLSIHIPMKSLDSTL
jgi:hypothetical protein